ncbi:hypothetical protein K0P33_06230 [Pseudomonas sp. ArH3a]|uniref:hypothetical protein n=1 Tax=Pseudomonas sp. ArH3a TaxID=2862945 RepID=UPI001F5649F7|nr:hypothetical protein [Pseudomonas sp. ArH3a]UNM21053.1 hypothetical protein K0P33_06230 [Pseudomonas sp. ArH3a]
MTDIPASSSAEHPGILRVAGAWITLFLLTIVYIINMADRFVLSTLIEPIKHAFNLSDTSVGFLTGVALTIFYAVGRDCFWGGLK